MIHVGDCVAWLRSLEPESADAIVTDPPYGIGFLGKEWDELPPGREWAEACHRVLKPGGHLVAFGSTRTVHRLMVAAEDGGLEIRDQIAWAYFQGLAKGKSLDIAMDAARDDEAEVRVVCRWLRAQIEAHPAESVRTLAERFDMHSRMIDHWAARDTDSQPTLPTLEQWEQLRAALGFGAEQDERVAQLNARKGTWGSPREDRVTEAWDRDVIKFSRGVREAGQPVTAEAREWAGWATQLKPALEPAVLARRKPVGTVAENVRLHRVGALNINGCRFAPGDPAWLGPDDGQLTTNHGRSGAGHRQWFDTRRQEAGQRPGQELGRYPVNLYYCPKPNRAEKERGCEALPVVDGRRNHHPTVKPVALFRWLCRLVCPPGGLVIDPFLGSGTTGVAAILEGFQFMGAEREAPYAAIAAARMAHAEAHPEEWGAKRRKGPRKTTPKPSPSPPPAQALLFGGGRG